MKIFDIKLFKFLIVGLLNTLIGSITMFVLYNLIGLSYWLSSASNYIVGSIVSYFLNKNFTFHFKNHSFKTVVKFILNILVCYLFAYGFAKPAVKLMLNNHNQKIQDNIAMLVGMVLFTLFNYVGQRFFAFKNDENKNT